MEKDLMSLLDDKNSIISDDELNELKDKLSSHMKNKLFFNSEPYKVHKQVNIYENYEGKNVRQSYYNNCIFDGANLSGTGLSGSMFRDCTFKPCVYTNTNFQSCDFRNCIFIGVVLDYTRMNKSSFYRVRFINCNFNSSSINDAIFDECDFANCYWNVSIENTLFKNTLFDSVKFKNMNFEFAEFDNIKTNNIKFPFPTIPFIFNGVKYIMNTNDNVRITSAKTPEGLTKNEYCQLLADLSKFYEKTFNFFPLVNILIAQGENEKAYKAVFTGVRRAIKIRAYRQIKYFCKQIRYIENVSAHQRQDLYKMILQETANNIVPMEAFERRAFEQYLPEIKDLLSCSNNDKKIQMIFYTNIQENDYERIAVLMSAFDSFLKGKCYYTLSFRHNSPFDVIFDAFANPDIAQMIVEGLVAIASIGFGYITCKMSSKDQKIVNEGSKILKENNIVVNNYIIINGGNVQISEELSPQDEIYLNK